MRPLSFSYAPSPSSANAVALNQQPLIGASLVLNGALASGGVVTMADQQIVTVTTGEDDSAINITLTGTDKLNNAISETLALPNHTLKAFTKFFKTITKATVDGTITANMTLGVNGLGSSQPYPLDVYISPFSVSVVVDTATGSPTYKAQYTYDDIYADGWANGTQHWFDSATMTGKTAAFVDVLTAPVMAVRFVITTAQANEVVAGRIIQAGIRS